MPKRYRAEYPDCKERHLPFNDDTGVKPSTADRRVCTRCAYYIRAKLKKWRELNAEPIDGLCPTCGCKPKYGHGFVHRSM